MHKEQLSVLIQLHLILRATSPIFSLPTPLSETQIPFCLFWSLNKPLMVLQT